MNSLFQVVLHLPSWCTERNASIRKLTHLPLACGAGRPDVGGVCAQRPRCAGTNPYHPEIRNPDSIPDCLDSSLCRTVVYEVFIRSPLASTQLTLGPYVGQIWSSTPPKFASLVLYLALAYSCRDCHLNEVGFSPVHVMKASLRRQRKKRCGEATSRSSLQVLEREFFIDNLLV